MTRLLLSVILVFISAKAFADADHGIELPVGATYYSGKQSIGLVGDEVDCYVEAVFSPKGSSADIRALIADRHDSTILVGQGPIKAKYSTSKKGYFFSSSDTNAPVTEMLLTAPTKKAADSMGITFFDEGHYDSVSCNKLIEAKDTALTDVMEKFDHFDDYIEEESDSNHDEDHDHQH